MLAKYLIIFLAAIARDIEAESKSWAIVGNPLVAAYPCNGTEAVFISYEPGRSPEEENEYFMFVSESFISHTNMRIKFDHGATVTTVTANVSRIYAVDDNTFLIRFYRQAKDGIGLTVKGKTQGVIPYPTSININTMEYCENPGVGILDSYLEGYKETAESAIKAPQGPTCGRKQVTHTELMTNSVPTKPGDWPWHVALYRFEKGTLRYKCGGTLISKTAVLTAAHCTTIRGVPVSTEILNVVLGKYNLVGGDMGAQEREIHEIVVHDKYNAFNLDHDISILKLKTEAVYGDYVQPACIWNPHVYDNLESSTVYGTVVGWGFDHTDQLAEQLRQASMPKVSESTCIKSDPLFFGRMLNSYKFCAGYRNGTSACNGDSGGGFTVFVPDESTSGPDGAGSWYLRGIVSVGMARTDRAVCDPNKYVVFTDTAKYNNWIEEHVGSQN